MSYYFARTFNKLYKKAGPRSVALRSGVDASAEATFMESVVLDLARFGTGEGRPGVFTRASRTGDDTDILNVVGGNPLSKIQTQNGGIVLLDSQDRKTNQQFTRRELESRYGDQIVNTLLAYARQNSRRLRRQTSE